MAAESLSSSEKVSVISFVPLMQYIGSVKRNVETNEEYVAFCGVPYAKIPIGLKRYQAPEPVEPPVQLPGPIQVKTYNANVTKKFSAQIVNEKMIGSVDCLYLNIYIPKRPESIEELLPVLVYFHGGGFTVGCNHPHHYPPDSIVRHGVIFITVSYRLGLHGFLNMHRKICPGNAGLKDQVRALEWVRDNIENFKGDPKNVTISGASAGATCVNLHLVAPLSKGLFHKAILQSGSVYCPWGYRGRQSAVRNTLMDDSLCKKLLLEPEDTEELHRRARQLLLADRERRHPCTVSPLFGPTLETIKEGAFISKTIDEMMQAEVDPKMPILAGITLNEGIHLFSVDQGRNHAEWVKNDYANLCFLEDNFRWGDETANDLSFGIRQRYFPNLSPVMSDKDIKCHLSKLLHDMYFRRFYDSFKFGPKRTLHKNLFVYQFEHFSELCCVACHERLLDTFPGVTTHGDELRYLYLPLSVRKKHEHLVTDPPPPTMYNIRLVMNHMSSLWTNFCKTGFPKSDFAPDVEWRPHSEENPCYLRIDENLLLEEGKSLCEDDWNWLNSHVNDKPVVPSRPPTPPTPPPAITTQ